jgi:ABC-type glycerol-3-phosphate transport system permease component
MSATIAASAPAVRVRRRARSSRKAVKQTLFYIGAAVIVLIALFPFYWILRTSLETNSQVSAGVGGKNGVIPSHLSLNAYMSIFSEGHFLTPLINSIIVALAATVLTVIVGSMAGYALARMNLHGAGAILGFILLAGFFPPLAMIGPLFLVFKDLGVLDNIYPLIIVYCVYTMPITTWLLKNFFEQIPVELEEAALVDGATRMQTLRKVIIPVAVPGVFTAAILSFILAWNDFIFAVSFLQTQSKFTAPLAIYTFGQSAFQTFYNQIDAAVVVISIPIAALVLIAQRRIVSGLTAGSFR